MDSSQHSVIAAPYSQTAQPEGILLAAEPNSPLCVHVRGKGKLHFVLVLPK